MYASRPAAFVLVSTDHGSMIVNTRDYENTAEGGQLGVGVEMFNYSHYDDAQLELLCKILELRRELHGNGVSVIDGGANIGAYTLEFARLMHGWGSVLAIEPQDRIAYALCGNVALNNCFNAKVLLAAIGITQGKAWMPRIDYTVPRNFGGVEASLSNPTGQPVQMINIDSLAMDRLDLLKLDIEGMEMDALEGAKNTLNTHHPILCIEHIKVGFDPLVKYLNALGYKVQMTGMNVLAIHESDPVGARITWYDSQKAA